MAPKVLQKLKIKNIPNNYSMSSNLKFDLTDKDQKHMIYKQFVVVFLEKLRRNELQPCSATIFKSWKDPRQEDI